jgi:hypothetical protein
MVVLSVLGIAGLQTLSQPRRGTARDRHFQSDKRQPGPARRTARAVGFRISFIGLLLLTIGAVSAY